MNGNVGTILLRMEMDNKGAVRVLQQSEKEVEKFARAGVKGFDDMSRSVGAFDGRLRLLDLKTLAIGTAAIGAGAAATMLFSATRAAGDYAESLSKVNTIFDDQADIIVDWSKTSATALGLSRQAALDAAGTMGNMFDQLGAGTKLAADNSRQMVTLAADLASFHNAAGGAAEVLEAMMSAFRGEYDPLQRYIPTINAAAVQQLALAETAKQSTKELTDLEKATAAMHLIMRDAGKAVGDFERTSGEAANQERILAAQMKDTFESIGEGLKPSYGAVLKSTNDWIASNDKLFQQDLPKALGEIAEAIPPVVSLAVQLTAAFLGASAESVHFVKRIWDSFGELKSAVQGVGKQFEGKSIWDRLGFTYSDQQAADLLKTRAVLRGVSVEEEVIYETEKKLADLREKLATAKVKPMQFSDYIRTLEAEIAAAKKRIADAKDEAEQILKTTSEQAKSIGDWHAMNKEMGVLGKSDLPKRQLGPSKAEVDLSKAQWKAFFAEIDNEEKKAWEDIQSRRSIETSALLTDFFGEIDAQELTFVGGIDHALTDFFSDMDEMDKRLSGSIQVSLTDQLAFIDRMNQSRKQSDLDYWDTKKRLLENEIETTDAIRRVIGISDNDFYKWSIEKWKAFNQQKTLATGDFVEGVAVAYQQMIDDEKAMAARGKIIFDDFVRYSGKAFSDSFASVIKGDFEDIGDAWDSLMDSMIGSFSNMLGEMMAEWAAKKVFSSMANGVSAVSSGASAVSGTGSTGFLPSIIGTASSTAPLDAGFMAGATVPGTGVLGALGGAGTAISAALPYFGIGLAAYGIIDSIFGGGDEPPNFALGGYNSVTGKLGYKNGGIANVDFNTGSDWDADIRQQYETGVNEIISDFNTSVASVMKMLPPAYADKFDAVLAGTNLGLVDLSGEHSAEDAQASLNNILSGFSDQYSEKLFETMRKSLGGFITSGGMYGSTLSGTGFLSRLSIDTQSAVVQSIQDIQSVTDAFDDYVQRTIDAYQQAADAAQVMADGITDTIKGLKYSNLNPYGDEATRWKMAQGDYNTYLQRALRGDVTAAGQVQQFASQYLTYAQNAMGDDQYRLVWMDTIEQLDQVRKVMDESADASTDKMNDLIDSTSSRLDLINTALAGVDASVMTSADRIVAAIGSIEVYSPMPESKGYAGGGWTYGTGPHWELLHDNEFIRNERDETALRANVAQMAASGGGPRQINIHVGNQEFYSEIIDIARWEADNVRVKANRRPRMATRRIYTRRPY